MDKEIEQIIRIIKRIQPDEVKEYLQKNIHKNEYDYYPHGWIKSFKEILINRITKEFS